MDVTSASLAKHHGYWNFEDHGAAGRKACGALLLTSGAVCFTAATVATWSFVDGSPTSDAYKYYYLLVAVTLPASIIFVNVNWLSVSFFKTA